MCLPERARLFPRIRDPVRGKVNEKECQRAEEGCVQRRSGRDPARDPNPRRMNVTFRLAVGIDNNRVAHKSKPHSRLYCSIKWDSWCPPVAVFRISDASTTPTAAASQTAIGGAVRNIAGVGC